ncbi:MULTISPECIES: hypothetical protein [Paraburkholderia]|uniref:Helix-turn-helix protein n=2 Tax=Paraburkholderia TaxID=1822464 RepID=A0A7Z0BAF0_9BURK|nr:hypothetical protein [Paraburkholderia bryophila]NYH27726.1 hypothetical protein [Paraburkholderia bryophila]
MNGRGFITISMHELERVKIIEAVVQHRLTIVLAAERLQLCVRQVERLVHFCSGARKNGQLDLWGLNFEQWIKLPLPRMGITHWVCPVVNSSDSNKVALRLTAKK